MTNLVDIDVFSEVNWEHTYQTIEPHANELISSGCPPFTPLMDLACLLTFVSAKQKLSDLIDTINTERTDFRPWKDFLDILLQTFDNKADVLYPEVCKLRYDPDFDHPWLQDGLRFLRVDLAYNLGLELVASYDFETEIAMTHTPWWRWELNYLWTWYNYRKGDWLQFEKALKQLTILTDEKLAVTTSMVHKLRGNGYSKQGVLVKAIQSYEQGLEEARRLNSPEQIGSFLNNLGVVYLDLGNFAKSEEYLLLSLERRKSNIDFILGWNNLGYARYCKGDYEGSYQAYSMAKEKINLTSTPGVGEGFNHLGFGLHSAIKGSIREALPHFNTALEIFNQFNLIHAQIYLHGIVARLFYDHREPALAEEHFNLFLEKLKQTKAYDSYFPFYATYVLWLISQKRYEEVDEHLFQLGMVASTLKTNKLTRVWHKYVQGVYETAKHNLTLAQELLDDLIKETTKNGPYELALRSLITLSEVLLQKYVLEANQSLLDVIADKLDMADDLMSRNPMYPNIILVKIYKAMLHAYKHEWIRVEPLVSQAEDLVVKFSHFTVKRQLQDLLQQVKSQKLLQGEFSRNLAFALRIGSGRQPLIESFQDDEFGLVVWKLTQMGPDVIAKVTPEHLIASNQVDVSLMLMGTLFISVLGQGDVYHEGVFGPLPVPTVSKQVHCMVGSKIVRDTKQEDARLKDKNYLLVAFLYPSSADVERVSLEETLTKWWNHIDDLGTFNEDEDDFGALWEMVRSSVKKLSY